MTALYLDSLLRWELIIEPIEGVDIVEHCISRKESGVH